ncbi:Uncharacterised protein [Mycobacteroides abscessus]|uniref:RecT-like ssDNA binding protein n=1 Tax=Mycobacteroides abscessus subsp. massiliense TaxID=1962118 RepID=A0AB38DI06_9MYCO|nr:hypothetical protein [Mycobacteroides abscessus]QSM02003.1 RecT-like ssDNA binding protein [Mycobacterium phage prophi68-1]QSM05048.1 RecT-like ssDNA binding protein [Mycobacterium phage prophiGD04-1]MBN7341734.1 hypothetical protein [Mycobacteroides abscessus subsp. massiliense]MBN7537901.1 hypothetical protein [Mycobacteroides abscessus subsp. massiliense]MDB2307007.1 hypothetical protein [Mycobacteroides abscessus subsp. massiliense]
MTIDTTDIDTEIEILPARRPSAAEALGALAAHVEAMHNAKVLGDALADTELVPETYRGKPGNAGAAILFGAELGLNPIQSLQQIFVVKGKPAIYARTAVALLKGHGIVVQTLETSDTSVTVTATDPRTGQVETSTWDIGRATTAKYTSNALYTTDPQAMLYAKAAMEVCRKIAPDILLGIPYSREELELEQQPVRVRSDRADRGLTGLRAAVIDTETESAPVEPTPGAPEAPEVQMITQPQSRKLYALLRERGLEDKDAALAWISSALNRADRPVASTKDLTKAESITLIDILESPRAEQPSTEGK